MCNHEQGRGIRPGESARTGRIKLLTAPAVLLLVLAAAGCSGTEPAVRPYERSLLNDPIMDPDRNPAAATYMRHVQECGEGARGGSGGALTSRSCY